MMYTDLKSKHDDETIFTSKLWVGKGCDWL